MVDAMEPWFSSFRQRARLLAEAREALHTGLPEAALVRLREPCLATSRTARRLRERSLDALWRQALERAATGHDSSLGRILMLMAAEDPGRVERFHALFRGGRSDPEERGPEPAPRPRLSELLEEMRRDAEAGGNAATPASDVAQSEPGTADHGAGSPAAADAGAEARPCGRGVRFHLAVDDGGEFLVASGSSLVLGHSRTRLADLPFLADVAPRHARLSCAESFHGGWVWTLESLAGNAATVDGAVVPPGGTELADGSEVALSQNLRFNVRVPDSASSSVVLELAAGAECSGAQRVLLIGPGPAGRVRIGARAGCTIPVAGLQHEIEMQLDGSRLRLVAPVGMRALGPGQSTASVLAEPELALPCPPSVRIDVVLDAPLPGRPPFSLSIRPEELP